ncbi:MAG: phosphotransferase [Halieaceae bacterium]|nr:phosphotransferase [Halieaceae bacterium]
MVNWAATELHLPVSEFTVAPLTGDASARRYFRLAHSDSSWMLADSPPESQKNAEFLAIRDALACAGARVPNLLAADAGKGWLLLEDLGDELLLPTLSKETVDDAYSDAIALLSLCQRVAPAELALPAYDESLLTEELSRFEEWFVAALLKSNASAAGHSAMGGLWHCLVESALEQPSIFVHRDFHSRNLMRLSDSLLAVIDFQDAVYGPITYDTVSLYKDCYIRWPREAVLAWVKRDHARLTGQAALSCDLDTFIRWFDWMGLQRHIKVLGTFARLYLRDGKDAYLNDLPLVVTYVRETLAMYAPTHPEFAAFSSWFEAELLSVIQQQAWYRG